MSNSITNFAPEDVLTLLVANLPGYVLTGLSWDRPTLLFRNIPALLRRKDERVRNVR